MDNAADIPKISLVSQKMAIVNDGIDKVVRVALAPASRREPRRARRHLAEGKRTASTGTPAMQAVYCGARSHDHMIEACGSGWISCPWLILEAGRRLQTILWMKSFAFANLARSSPTGNDSTRVEWGNCKFCFCFVCLVYRDMATVGLVVPPLFPLYKAFDWNSAKMATSYFYSNSDHWSPNWWWLPF